jgi:hypothetical protein
MEVAQSNGSIVVVERAAPPCALVPLRRRASFLLGGGAVSVSMLRGDLETECLLEDVVDDGLDDDEPFFLEKRLVVFFHMVAALFSPLKFRVATGN